MDNTAFKNECSIMSQNTMTEWVTLNTATIFATWFASLSDMSVAGFVTVISALALAFFNVMRGLKVYQEYKYSKEERDNSRKKNKGAWKSKE